jgi:LysM repeat protein
MLRNLSQLICLGILLTASACVRERSNIIIVTSTPSIGSVVLPASTQAPAQTTESVSQQALSNPTANATRQTLNIPSQHTVQSGDTLSGIAAQYNVTVSAILAANDLFNPDILTIGQVINLPNIPERQTPALKIIPDSRLVRAPNSANFDIAAFIAQQPGYIRNALDQVEIHIANGAALPKTENAAQIINRVALEYSVDPRLLLAILEFRAGWLSNPVPREDLLVRPLVSEETAPTVAGLYKQLSWAANELNRGYYVWKYHGMSILSFVDGTRLVFNPALNGGTIAVQYFLSLDAKPYNIWLNEVSPSGIYATYGRYFADPFMDSIEPLVPNNIQQPPLLLPFEAGIEWRYTGGPHGGWGSGSAWGALDFAPSQGRPADTFCYIANEWVTAVAPGTIARNGEGVLVLDLDGDSDESTGWTINYLHLSIDDTIQTGLRVNAGDRLGRPSCEGGFSNATHLHISRRFNGEWLPADCQDCIYTVPSFEMGGWRIVGIENQYYQGFMVKDGQEIQAEQGRDIDGNRISG